MRARYACTHGAFNVYVSAGVHASTYTHTQTRTCSHTRQVRRAGTARKARSRPAERFVWPPLRPGHGRPPSPALGGRTRHLAKPQRGYSSARTNLARESTWLASQLASRASLQR